MVKPVKFTRDSGCLARDEFLVISEGDRMLIYIFVIFVLLGTELNMKKWLTNSQFELREARAPRQTPSSSLNTRKDKRRGHRNRPTVLTFTIHRQGAVRT